MKNNFLSDKLDALYKKEAYNHPLQFRTKPDTSITGEKPDEDKIGRVMQSTKDEKSKENLDLENNKKDIRTIKKSSPKEWSFKGPRISVKQNEK